MCHECHWSLRSLTISDWEGVFQPIINIIYNIYYDGECIRKSLMTLLTRDTHDISMLDGSAFFLKKSEDLFVDRNVDVVSLHCHSERRNSALTKEKKSPS